MVRDCPGLRRGAPPQTTQAPWIPHGPQGSQAMVATSVIAPPTPPARGRGQEDLGRPRGGGQVRFYVFPSRTVAFASDVVITGMVSVCRRDASVLFDQRSTYSYVSYYFASYLDISIDSLSAYVFVSMPVGDSIIVDRVYRPCLVVTGSFETRVNLLLLRMVDFDVIFGMDWLSPYHAILDCHAKTVTLAMPRLSRLEGRGGYIGLYS
ncbi:uncharacterized protein [Nicotiana tomentosiformis]|uniref:uncharacterized protein n=1 Tax=Nicotiana tomentosiformis TaxID=4098 RepID=UPI00388C9918